MNIQFTCFFGIPSNNEYSIHIFFWYTVKKWIFNSHFFLVYRQIMNIQFTCFFGIPSNNEYSIHIFFWYIEYGDCQILGTSIFNHDDSTRTRGMIHGIALQLIKRGNWSNPLLFHGCIHGKRWEKCIYKREECWLPCSITRGYFEQLSKLSKLSKLSHETYPHPIPFFWENTNTPTVPDINPSDATIIYQLYRHMIHIFDGWSTRNKTSWERLGN